MLCSRIGEKRKWMPRIKADRALQLILIFAQQRVAALLHCLLLFKDACRPKALDRSGMLGLRARGLPPVELRTPYLSSDSRCDLLNL
jgi:hypothetical protein